VCAVCVRVRPRPSAGLGVHVRVRGGTRARGEYDDTVVIPELRPNKEESQGLRPARTLRTDEKKVLIRDAGVDERVVATSLELVRHTVKRDLFLQSVTTFALSYWESF
jgi:hypothetical protein